MGVPILYCVTRREPHKTYNASQGPGQGPARARPRARQGPGQGSAMHHGLCPAMYGHLRRDTDLILRPSESTIDFLSMFIGFSR